MIEPKIETLLEGVDSKYTLVLLAAKRGRQINSYFTQLGEGVAEYTPPQVPLSADRAPQGALDSPPGDRRGQGHLRAHRRRHQVAEAPT